MQLVVILRVMNLAETGSSLAEIKPRKFHLPSYLYDFTQSDQKFSQKIRHDHDKAYEHHLTRYDNSNRKTIQNDTITLTKQLDMTILTKLDTVRYVNFT